MSNFTECLDQGKWLTRHGEAIPFAEMEDGHLYAILHAKYNYIRRDIYEQSDLFERRYDIAKAILSCLPKNFLRVLTIDYDKLDIYIQKTHIPREQVYEIICQERSILAIKPELIKRGIWDNFWGLSKETKDTEGI